MFSIHVFQKNHLEIATQQAYDCYVLLSIVKSKAANESLFSEFEKLFPSNIEQIKSESPDKLERAMWAGESFLKYFLELCNQTNLKTDEDVALLKLKFDFNSHNEGGRSGCFPEASYFNHNCEPNSKCSFTDDDKLQVRAISKITANSELSISYVYLPPFEQDSRESLEERQEYLQKHFLFKCNCERCQKLMKM